ncbi:MAG: HNH endonuclease [Actinomycetia bacterium]|nr:HNH endonuclease [Actinomycetes bacterium]
MRSEHGLAHGDRTTDEIADITHRRPPRRSPPVLPTPVLPDAVADVLADTRTLARCAAGVSAGGPATAEERAAWLTGLRLVIDAAEAAFTSVLANFDANGDGEVLHAAASTQSWLRGALGMASGEASERVRIARTTGDLLAAPVAALVAEPHGSHSAGGASETNGHLSYEHLRTIHRTARALPPSARPAGVEVLAGLGSQLGIDDLRSAGRHLRHVVDPDGSARHAEEDFGRRWLSLAPMLDGMHSIDGVLDAETAAGLSAALAPFLVPNGPDDTRTSDQRRADGLAEVVAAAVRSGELPALFGATTAMQVEVELATLTGERSHPARIPGTTGSAVWLTSDAASRLACDASVRRLLVDPNGIPLDLGREVRVFTPAQRRALATRDGGCRFPGCNRPSVHTDAHHLVPWARGGQSDLVNGLLLCRHHHRAVHEGGWQIRPDSSNEGANGALHFQGPAGQQFVSPLLAARLPGARAAPGP